MNPIKRIVMAMGLGVFALSGCGSNEANPPPLPGQKDGGKDAIGDGGEASDGGVDVIEQSDAQTDVSVQDDAAQEDGSVQEDAIQGDGALQQDAVGNDAGGDASVQNDAGAGQDASVQQNSYQCTLTAEDKYGMHYGMFFTTKNPVTVDAVGSWTGDAQFTGASGTDPVLEGSRRNKKAFTWPQAGQNVASSATDLTGTYRAEFQRLTGNAATIKLKSYYSNGTAPTTVSPRAVLPATWTNAAGLPEAIASDTSNEVYMSMDVPLFVGGNCYLSSVCEHFMGTVSVSDTTWPSTIYPPNYFSSITVKCDQI